MSRKVLSAIVGMALTAGPLAAHALEAKLSGQINRALMYADDGFNPETYHVDNDVSSTRFRFVGSDDITSGVKAGIVFEVEMQSNPSDQVSATNKSIGSSLDERQINLFFQGGFGKVVLGQSPGAADGAAEVDLSGTDVVQGSLGAFSLGGAIAFRTGAGVAGPTIAQTISNQDFESRYDLVRYETPPLGPVKLVLSTGVKDNFDVDEAAAWYSGNVGDGKLAGVLGFSKQSTPGTEDETVGGSISWLLASGLNFTFATTSRDTGGRDREFTLFKVGYKFGQHAVAVDYAMGEDQAAAGDESDLIGVGYVYMPAKWAELYAGVKSHSLDRPGTNFDDIQILTLGSRLKF